MHVFVTVGTSRFDALVSAVLSNADVSSALSDKGVRDLTLQVGNSPVGSLVGPKGVYHSLELYKFSPDILPDIRKADLVISHAGAGTCMEVLSAGKPLIIIANDSLMDNHQIELAKKLSSYAEVSSIQELPSAIRRFPFAKEPYTPGNPSDFAEFIESLF